MVEGKGRLELSAALALGSVLVRNPFTLSYARESTPNEYWETPEFLSLNYLISWVWVAAFVVEAVSGFIGDGVLRGLPASRLKCGGESACTPDSERQTR